MKKWFVLFSTMFLFLIVSQDVQAEVWQEGETIKGKYINNEKSIYTIELQEDSLVEFTLKEGVNFYTGYEILNRYLITLFDESGNSFGNIPVDIIDENDEITIQQINLKKERKNVR